MRGMGGARASASAAPSASARIASALLAAASSQSPFDLGADVHNFQTENRTCQQNIKMQNSAEVQKY